MHHGRITGANVIFTKPDDWDDAEGPCQEIHARIEKKAGARRFVTAWFPTIRELEAMVVGAPVYLSVRGNKMPHVELSAGQPADDITPFPRAISVTRSIMGARVITIHFEKAPTEDDLNSLRAFLK